MKLKIVGFITSDWHWDSMGGLKIINNLGVPTYANEMTRDDAQQKGLPLPNKTFNCLYNLLFIQCPFLRFYSPK